MFQNFLPRARPLVVNSDSNSYFDYSANLRPGYKGGTKFIFDDHFTGQPGVEVHVVLKEAKHPIYRRIGNDLHVTCRISRQQAKAGCQIEIPALQDDDYVLRVDLPAGSRHGDTFTFPGKGWPNRKQKGTKGNLIVTVSVMTLFKMSPRR
jgi:DnaJ-class molecular chaperone